MKSKGIAVITGASSGIGKIYAERLAASGYDLILVARNVPQLQQQAGNLLMRFGATCEVFKADLAQRTDLMALAKRVRTDQTISMLVNCAGLPGGGPLASTDMETLMGMLDVNVIALSACCAAAAANFSDQGGGTIVNVSSATAFIDTPMAGAYASSKAFVLHLTYALDLELQDKGVKVQAVLPGYTRTPMLAEAKHIPDHMMMEVETLVDAALAGLEAGELITIPSLEDQAKLTAWEAAKHALVPEISRDLPASRYLRTPELT